MLPTMAFGERRFFLCWIIPRAEVQEEWHSRTNIACKSGSHRNGILNELIEKPAGISRFGRFRFLLDDLSQMLKEQFIDQDSYNAIIVPHSSCRDTVVDMIEI